MTEDYKKKHGVDSFIWEDRYNFDNIETNCLEFESKLRNPADDDNDDSDTSPEDRSINCFYMDDGNSLETYGIPEEDLDSISEYFVTQIRDHDIINHIGEDEDRDNHVILRWRGVLVELNDVNTRCFYEMIKWKKLIVSNDQMIYLLC